MNKLYLEWETIPEEEYLIKRSNFGAINSILKIWRDEDYQLHFSIEMSQNDFLNSKNKLYDRTKSLKLIGIQVIPNKRIFIRNLIITESKSTEYGTKYILLGIYTNSCHYIRPKIETSFYNVHFYLNSPNNFPFPENTAYEEKTLINYNIGRFSEDQFERNGKNSYSNNCLTLSINRKEIALVSVKNQNTKGMYLRSKMGESVSEAEAELVRNVFSFLTSTKLVYLGSAEIHNDFSKHKNFQISSFESGIKRFIDKSEAFFPFPHSHFSYRAENYDTNATIQIFLDNYQRLKTEFLLDTVFYLIQNSRNSDFSLQIQPLAAAYDIIKKCWFKSNLSKSKGKYLDDIDFGTVLKDILPTLENKLKNAKYSTAILNRIKNANEITSSQKDSFFFDEIGLAYGDIEKFAWQSRNLVVHGAISNNTNKIIFMNMSYQTLINRIILHLLGIKEYIDYTTNRRIIRNTTEMMMGLNEDGKIPTF
ncbi:hypothetical protein [Leptospira kanakyensis]|uniref:hypothetical protein n=1 Tax=Leptospira kanakyensis TaxID=2484968 RepID=UPI00223DD022|nr:hypothetical protein [Leptospira kanakyensis]MCW7483243.1 hypothetical protein [Leptospira kanakyensis]